MKRQILILLTFLCSIQFSYAQVVSGGTQVQGKTVKPGELGGSSFNGDVNLFTGTYSGSYTVGSVSTPGGLKFDLNMVYSSSLSGGDNVPVAKGIPYGEGWDVLVPTINVSAASYKSYSEYILNLDAATANAGDSINNSKVFGGDGGLYWFSPTVNIPGVVSGEFVYKELDPNSGFPIFVLHKFEDQYVELHFDGTIFTVVLPNGDHYEFSGRVSYQKGYNKRKNPYSEGFNNTIGAIQAGEQFGVRENIKPKSEKLTWHCSRIFNTNLPKQVIFFTYKSYGEFNFFKEFSEDVQGPFNHALRPPGAGPMIPLSLPSLPVSTDVFLQQVSSTTGKVVLEYEDADADHYGADMLNPNNPDSTVKRVDDLYNKQVVYSSTDELFNSWKRYYHAKAPEIQSQYPNAWNIQPSATNPYVATHGGTFGSNGASVMMRKNVQAGQTMLSFEHGFLESPRLKDGIGTNEIPLIGGDIYEIKTTVSNTNPLAHRTANIDINIATGKLDPLLSEDPTHHYSASGLDVGDASYRANNYVNETVFSTFGNAVKWNPSYTGGRTTVHTSNYFTMPNIPDEYEGITLQIGPANSDNYFNFTPRDVCDLNGAINAGSVKNAHRTYWQENFQTGFLGGWSAGTHNTPRKQPYDAVPHNFGIGLPWMMMKPLAHMALGNLTPNSGSEMFDFWWFDEDDQFNNSLFPDSLEYSNVPTLLGSSANLSNVEIIRYSKNPHMLKAVKTYKYNGAYHEAPYPNPTSIPGPVLVNQFDFEHKSEDSDIINNTFYGSGSTQTPTSRKSTTFLLKSIKNVPVNGSKDASNTISTNTVEYPTTHFEYNPYAAGLPLIEAGDDDEAFSLRTNSNLYVLDKVISHLGKETNIGYYDFTDTSTPRFTFFRFSGPRINSPNPTTHSIADRNFAVQINIPVKTISIDAPGGAQQWDYAYGDRAQQEGLNFSGADNNYDDDILVGGARNTSGGWKTTTVTEPAIGSGLRPYSKYYHHGLTYADYNNVTQENLLFGKLKKVENYDGTGFKVSQKEIEYDASLAFKNGINRNAAFKGGEIPGFEKGQNINATYTVNGVPVSITTTFIPHPDSTHLPDIPQYHISVNGGLPQTYYTLRVIDPINMYYDYQDFTHVFDSNLVYQKRAVPAGMGGTTLVASASQALETSSLFSSLAKDAYFIKKVKETDTEYESNVCNIPKPDEEINNGQGDLSMARAAVVPVDPIINVKTKVGDNLLINKIDEARFGRDVEEDLMNASPLSDSVLHAFMDKRPYFDAETYSKIIIEQSFLSDSVLLKTLSLDNEFRETVLNDAVVNQQGKLSESVLRSLVAENLSNTALLNTALLQYNSLPEDILISILNKDPEYTHTFIESVLVSQVAMSPTVHDLLLSKTEIPDNVVKKVFINGGNYPSENTLIEMINRPEDIATQVIEDVLLASEYQHTQPTMLALTTKFGNLSEIHNHVVAHNSTKPVWSKYCSEPATTVVLSMQNIVEFEYWDANEEGQTTSEGFKKLMDINDPAIDLMYEPSWQLYRTKNYSPQLPEAFTEKEYFYYYDLKNKYNRLPKYLPNNHPYLVFEDANVASNNSLEPYNCYFAYDYDIQFHDGQKGLKGFKPDGLRFSHDLNLLNVAYQERTTSKNVSDAHPIARSTYYYYNSDWNDIVEDFTTTEIPYDGPDCPVDLDSNSVPVDEECVVVKGIHFNPANVPPSWIVWYSHGNTLLSICPPDLDTAGLGYGEIYYESLVNIVDTANTGNRAPFTNDLRRTLHLKEVFTQIDTLINAEHYSAIHDTYNPAHGPVPFPSQSGLMEFQFEGRTPFSDIYNYTPIYPFDVLKVKEIKERNQFTQVQLEENEQGLQTRYYYDISKNLRYIDTNCTIQGYGTYNTANFPNIGVPTAITVGYGLSDSLRTEYEYNLDYSVKNITDPNGINLSYKYDEYGRLKESYRNNELLSINKYSTWNNQSATFDAIAEQNYVETFQLKDAGSNAALHSRKLIDPLGRDYHTMSREIADVTTYTNAANEVVHTGAISYDNWNRATTTYKPFVDVSGTFQYVQNSVNPNDSSAAAYENDQRSRVLREAKPGLALGATENVKYRYSMSNYICGGCDLALNAEESRLIMGVNPDSVRFKVVEVEDEDGKVSQEFFNALGQKVATKQFIGIDEAITLFIYDSYGNLTKVINPEKQESTYAYNMLGWLYQKETVDGGITKYMFNESGQVVLEQDEKDRAERSCEEVTFTNYEGTSITDFVSRPTYRSYAYDLFGRMTGQHKRVFHPESNYYENTVDLPMLYKDKLQNVLKSTTFDPNESPVVSHELFYDGYYYRPTQAIINQISSLMVKNAFVYKFTNNSTYAWKAVTHHYKVVQQGPTSQHVFVDDQNFLPQSQIFTSTDFAEKELFYNNTSGIPTLNQHIVTNTVLAAGRQNMKGNLSYTITYNNSTCEELEKPIKYDYYNYNNEGNVVWQIQQFNPTGIDSTHKGIVTRIDYPKYDLNNNLLVENIDVNNDLELDLQYNYTYDLRNRLTEVKVGLTDNNTRELVASYAYNDATGLITQTNYHKDCTSGTGNLLTDQIYYTYDERDRLDSIGSNFFDYTLYYDNNIPTTALGAFTTFSNYNGNINGIQSTYKFNGFTPVPNSNFTKPSTYVYEYDGINRLTKANGFWDENSVASNLLNGAAEHGDVTYQFDKIGNFKELNRAIDATGGLEHWKYEYQNGSNRLMKVQGLSGTLDRNYTYDGSGNLLTDDFRKVAGTVYGRANLPFDVTLERKKSGYLYDASDARIYKGLYSTLPSEIGVVNVSEYYLKDAAGNTVGILDLNKEEWTWYVFGRERFAKIKPDTAQQPTYFNADFSATLVNDGSYDASAVEDFVDEVKTVLEARPEEQVHLLRIEQSNAVELWVSESNLTTFTENLAEGITYTIREEVMLTEKNHQLKIGNNMISVGALTEMKLAYLKDSVSLDTNRITVEGNELLTITNPLTNAFISINVEPDLTGDGSGGGGTSGGSSTLPPLEFNYSHHNDTLLTDMDYYIHDHLGNTRVVYTPTAVICGADPRVDYNLKYAADYFAYGKILREWQPATGPEKYLTTHHERDTETGLDYRGARYYDGDVVRLLSLDPKAKDYPSLSDYGYVAGNPIIFIDPDGRDIKIASVGESRGKGVRPKTVIVTYKNGVLTNKDGSEYHRGQNAFIDNVAQTLDNIRELGGAANELIQALQDDASKVGTAHIQSNHILQMMRGNEESGSFTTRRPGSKNSVVQFQPDVTRAKFGSDYTDDEILGHELRHSFINSLELHDKVKGVTVNSNGKKILNSEIDAVQFQNVIRDGQGNDPKTTYNKENIPSDLVNPDLFKLKF